MLATVVHKVRTLMHKVATLVHKLGTVVHKPGTLVHKVGTLVHKLDAARSPVRHLRHAFTIRRVCQAGEDVLVRQVGEVGKDLCLCHPGGEVRQDVIDRDAEATDARPAASFFGLNGDDVCVVHAAKFSDGDTSSQRRHRPHRYGNDNISNFGFDAVVARVIVTSK